MLKKLKELSDPSVDLLPPNSLGNVGRYRDRILRHILRDAIRIICEPSLVNLFAGAVDRFSSYV